MSVTTRHLVEASASVVAITKLSRGDVYKRLTKESYQNTYDIRFGIVTDVLANGTDVAITALEFEDSYTESKTAMKVFGGDSELQLFACDPSELSSHFDGLRAAANRRTEDYRNRLHKEEAFMAHLDRVEDQARSGELTAAHTTPIEA